MATETTASNDDEKPAHATVLSVGNWTREDMLARLAEIERRKNDPEWIAYVQRLGEGAAEARRQINEQERRGIEEEEEKLSEMTMAMEEVKTQSAGDQGPTSPLNTGMNDAEFASLLAHIERRKNKPGYFERWESQVAEYRRQVQEQAERELAQEGK